MILSKKYGTLALIAGASEGIGAAYARRLASEGFNLILIARGEPKLQHFAATLRKEYNVTVDCFVCDLSLENASDMIQKFVGDRIVNVLVYNAALSYIGDFEKQPLSAHQNIMRANMNTTLGLAYAFGQKMLHDKKGAIILMASIAGFQGSGFLATYAATKAFDRVLAEGLWYEWKDKGVDVIACCAGATSTPNFLNTKPAKQSFFAPRVQSPEEVVDECFKKLGKTPSFVSGQGNKIATFIMQRLLPRKLAIKIMGDTAREMYF